MGSTIEGSEQTEVQPTANSDTDGTLYGFPLSVNVDPLVGVGLLAAAITFLVNRWRERVLRIRELRQGRMQLLFDFRDALSSDPDCKAGRMLLNNWRYADVSFEEIFPESATTDANEQAELTAALDEVTRAQMAWQIDQVYSRLQCIAIAEAYEEFSRTERSQFDFYFEQVVDEPVLGNYCRKYYPEIVKIGHEIKQLKASKGQP